MEWIKILFDFVSFVVNVKNKCIHSFINKNSGQIKFFKIFTWKQTNSGSKALECRKEIRITKISKR